MIDGVWLLLVGAALGTYLLRLAPLALPSQLWDHKLLSRLGGVVPPAILAAVLVPLVAVVDGQLMVGRQNPDLTALLITMLAAFFSRNIAVAVVLGVAARGLLG